MKIKNYRRNFIPRNEGFLCEQCGAQVPPASSTFRNHCPECLTSKHVDTIPGDRAAQCGGLMLPIGIEGTDPDALVIMHRCQHCHIERRNRAAPDDNKDALLRVYSPTKR